MWSLYNRLLLRPAGKFLPLRRCVRKVRLPGKSEAVCVRLGTTDWHVLEEIFFQGEYDEMLQRLDPPVRTIVDLGANVGLSLRLWRERFPAARVIAVEPDAENIVMCRRNGGESCELVQACAAGSRRQVYLDRSGGEWAASMRDRPVESAGEAIPTITVEELCDRIAPGGEIDLLKCDIEGAEKEVFADCSRWIGRVRNIMIETHAPYTAEQFLADVARCGGEFETRMMAVEGGLGHALLVRKRPGGEGA